MLVMAPGESHNSGSSTLTGSPTTQTAGGSVTLTVKFTDLYYNTLSSDTTSRYLRFTSTATASPNSTNPILASNGTKSFSAGASDVAGFTFYNAAQSDLTVQVQYCSDGPACATIANTTTSSVIPMTPAAAVGAIQVVAATGPGATPIGNVTYSSLDSDPTFYAKFLDAYGNFKSNSSVSWQATRTVAGDKNADLSSLSGTSTNLALSTVGAGDVVVTASDSGSAQSDSTGTLTIYAQGASQYFAELESVGTKTAGSAFNVKVTAKKPDGSTATDYAGSKSLSLSTTAGNGAAGCSAASLTPELPSSANFTSGVALIPITLKKAESGVTVTVAPSSGNITSSTTPAITVQGGALECIELRTAANNGGSLVADPLNLSVDGSQLAYAAGFDAYKNFIGDQSANWSGSADLSGLPLPEGSSTWSRLVGVKAGSGNFTATVGAVSKSIAATVGTGNRSITTASVDSYSKYLLYSDTIQATHSWDLLQDSSHTWTTSSTSATWYTEAGSNCTTNNHRGCRYTFPKKVHLIATASELSVIDATTNDLFIRFQLGSGYAIDNALGSITSLAALNGRIYVGMSDGSSTGGLIVIDWPNDSVYAITSSSRKVATGLSARNTSMSWNNTTAYPLLTSEPVRTLFARNIAGNDYLVVGTNNSAQLLEDDTGTRSIYSDSTSNAVNAVAIDSDGRLYYAENTLGLHRADLNLTSLADFTPTRTWNMTTTAKLASLNINKIQIAENTSSAQAGENTILIATDRGLSAIQEHTTAGSSVSTHYDVKGNGADPAVFKQAVSLRQGTVSAATNANAPSTLMTAEVFFMPATHLSGTGMGSDRQVLFQIGDGSKTTDGNYGLEYDVNTGRLSFYIGTTTGAHYLNSISTSWNKNQWYHVVVQFNQSSGDMDLWVNGVNQHSTVTAPTLLSGTLYLGSNNGATGTYLAGSVDEFILQKSTSYPSNSNISVRTSEATSDGNTTYLYHFNSVTGRSATDSSANASDATLSDQAWFTQRSLDGTNNNISTLQSFVLNGQVSAAIGVSGSGYYTEMTSLETTDSASVVRSTSVGTGVQSLSIFQIDSATNFDILLGFPSNGVQLQRR